MAQTARRKTTYRVYDDEEKASALETVNLCGGNIAEAARLSGVPEDTLRVWARGHCVSEAVFKDFTAKKQGRMTAKLRALADRLADALASEEKIETARYGELSTTFGIVFDKIRLMDAEPTQISEYRHRVTREEAEGYLADWLPLFDGDREQAIAALGEVDPEAAGALIH